MDGFEIMVIEFEVVGIMFLDVVLCWCVQNFVFDYDLVLYFDIMVCLQYMFVSEGCWIIKGGLEQIGVNYIEFGLDG